MEPKTQSIPFIPPVPEPAMANPYPVRSAYLGGPITALTHDESRYGWRQEFADITKEMALGHIHLFSPMRGKGFLAHLGKLSSGSDYPNHPMASASGITVRDVNDCHHCDVMVACFLETPLDSYGQELASIGTSFEFGVYYVLQKPIIMIAEPGNIHAKHVMLKHAAAYTVPTLREGAELLGFLLTPGI